MSKWYVGVDVGKDELVAAVEGRSAKVFANTAAGRKALYQWAQKLSSGQPLFICTEATGVYGYRAVAFWYTCPETEVSVVNPAQIAAFAKAQLRRSKTDALDAQVILAFAQSQQPQPWRPQSPVMNQLYALVSEWDALAETKQRLANRSHSHGYLPTLPSAVAQAQASTLRCLNRQIARLQKALLELCQATPELSSQVTLLSTIPGVKANTALHLLAYGKHALLTYSPRQLTAHAGLAPHHRQSGSSIRGKTRLAKQGDKRLRTILYMPTLSCLRSNPIIKIRYHKFLANGKSKMAAVVACMRKLLLMAQAMLKNNSPFNPDIIPLT
jgi:transposase